MTMTVLAGAAGAAVAAAVIVFLAFLLSRVKAERQAARTETARVLVRLSGAQSAVQRADEKCAELARYLEASQASTQQALSLAEHIDTVGQQVRSLVALVRQPELEQGGQ